jgi:hypothetical protein
MLLSFAQFEREVTAERIRDKIAASKARGMWMGGTPPLGYAPNDRSLQIVEEHAALIRHLFARYLALGSVRLLEEELVGAGISVPARTRLSGAAMGGGAFTRGQLYLILRNVVYTGRISHKDKIYPGLHPAIIDIATFDAAQAKLTDHRQGHRSRAGAAESSPLAGKIVDADGEPLIATHANKGKVRHRYYVSRSLHLATTDVGMRVPAREIEALATAQVVKLLGEPLELASAAALNLRVDQVVAFHNRCALLASEVQERRSPALAAILRNVRVEPTGVVITCNAASLATTIGIEQLAGGPATIEISSSAQLKRSGRLLRLVQESGDVAQATPDRALVRLLIQARRWWAILRARQISTGELAAREGVTSSYVTRVVRLAFLAPAVTEAILAGRQRTGVTAASLTLDTIIPPDWATQQTTMLPMSSRR